MAERFPEAVIFAILKSPVAVIPPDTVSLLVILAGVEEPIPTFPVSSTVKASPTPLAPPAQSLQRSESNLKVAQAAFY